MQKQDWDKYLVVFRKIWSTAQSVKNECQFAAEFVVRKSELAMGWSRKARSKSNPEITTTVTAFFTTTTVDARTRWYRCQCSDGDFEWLQDTTDEDSDEWGSGGDQDTTDALETTDTTPDHEPPRTPEKFLSLMIDG